MRKFTIIMLLVLFCLTLASCKTNRSIETKEELIKAAVAKYYLLVDKNKGEFKIYNIKPFKDKYLVLAENFLDVGNGFPNLFLIDEKYNIVSYTGGESPISMCFSINKVDYGENTILFGTFNNSKWHPKTDEKSNVQIDKIDIKFSSKQSVKENVLMENGYIVFSSPVSKVEEFNIYNEKNELQSSIADLEEYGQVINTDTQFCEFKGK